MLRNFYTSYTASKLSLEVFDPKRCWFVHSMRVHYECSVEMCFGDKFKVEIAVQRLGKRLYGVGLLGTSTIGLQQWLAVYTNTTALPEPLAMFKMVLGFLQLPYPLQNGIQNGCPRWVVGHWWWDNDCGSVLSYEGEFTAVGGAAEWDVWVAIFEFQKLQSRAYLGFIMPN